MSETSLSFHFEKTALKNKKASEVTKLVQVAIRAENAPTLDGWVVVTESDFTVETKSAISAQAGFFEIHIDSQSYVYMAVF